MKGEGKRKRRKAFATRVAGMNAERLEDVTREFDQEMIVDRSRALKRRERVRWTRVTRKRGRPRTDAGAKVISVSVEGGLLARANALAKSLGISRASLFARGLRAVLAAEGRL